MRCLRKLFIAAACCCMLLVILSLLPGCQIRKPLQWEDNLWTGIQKSKATNKPIFLYFTCYGCVGYDEFFQDFIEEREIVSELSDSYITVILFVDDKSPIQVNDTLGWTDLELAGITAEQVRNANKRGDLYATFQQVKFGQNTQPMYVVVNSDLSTRVAPFFYCKRDMEIFLSQLRK